MHDQPGVNPIFQTALSGDAKQPAQPIRNMRVKLWGVQGSCPIFPSCEEIQDYARRVAWYAMSQSPPGAAGQPDFSCPAIDMPDLPIYGGDTSCIEIETAEGNVLALDLGTGARAFSRALLAKWQGRPERTLYVFGTHPHLDHRMGLTFSGFCFATPNPFTVRVYGSRLFLAALDERYGLFSQKITPEMHLDDPLDYRLMSARFTGTELRPDEDEDDPSPNPWAVQRASQPVHVGSTAITAFPVYHGPMPCLAYKVRHGSASFVYCTDHELRHGADPGDPRQLQSEAAEAEVLRQCQGVDAAYFDGQYLAAEYRGEQGIGLTPPVSRVDWGHSCLEDVISRASACGIGRTYVGHHDPERPYDQRVELDQSLRRLSQSNGIQIQLAKAAEVIEL